MPRRDLPHAKHLRLIDGDRREAAPVDEVVVARAAVRGERNEPWTLPVTDELRALDEDAARAGLDLEIALRLVTETALVSRDLEGVGVSLELLDAAAACATVDLRVDACDAAYLRRLTTSTARATRPLDAVVIAGLPARLSTRLLAVDVSDLVRDASLSRARAWEIAAVLSGRTISEWAPLTALRFDRR